MPRLQIDGMNIAEITAERAKELTEAAKRGLGNEASPAGFPTAVLYHMPTPKPPRIEFALVLAFPE